MLHLISLVPAPCASPSGIWGAHLGLLALSDTWFSLSTTYGYVRDDLNSPWRVWCCASFVTNFVVVVVSVMRPVVRTRVRRVLSSSAYRRGYRALVSPTTTDDQMTRAARQDRHQKRGGHRRNKKTWGVVFSWVGGKSFGAIRSQEARRFN